MDPNTTQDLLPKELYKRLVTKVARRNRIMLLFRITTMLVLILAFGGAFYRDVFAAFSLGFVSVLSIVIIYNHDQLKVTLRLLDPLYSDHDTKK